LAGATGFSSDVPSGPVQQPSGQLAGGRDNPNYPGSAGRGGGTARGGSAGAAVISFELTGVSVNDGPSFKPANTIWIKVADVWQEVQSVYVKEAGVWKATIGSINPSFFSIFGNFGVAPRPAAASDEEGGGGGKIICQKLSEMGYFDTEMNRADQLFGVQLQQGDPDAYAGYVRWARPVVVLLEGGGSETLRKLVLFWEKDSQKRKDIQSSIVAYYLDKLARPWAEEMAYRMQAPGHTQSNTAGRFIMNVGLPMCRVIGRWGKDNQWPMWAKTLSIWGTVTVLLVTIATISTVDKLLGKLRKLIGK
jgi:hypothetical protein